MSADHVPSPTDVYGRPRVFDHGAPRGSRPREAAHTLDVACSAIEDLAASLMLLRRDPSERFVDLNIARLHRAEVRAHDAIEALDVALALLPVPAPVDAPLPPLARPAGRPTEVTR